MAYDLKALSQLPDASGHFGPYGGRFVSETLVSALDELSELYERLSQDADFRRSLIAIWLTM